MTITEMGARLGVPTCTGGCGLSATRHRTGCIFLGVVHYAERRFTRRAARTYLMLVARLERENDPAFLNDEVYDWLYPYIDSVEAGKLAMQLGFRLPAAVFDRQREQVRSLAARRGVKLSRRGNLYQWLNRKETR